MGGQVKRGGRDISVGVTHQWEVGEVRGGMTSMAGETQEWVTVGGGHDIYGVWILIQTG